MAKGKNIKSVWQNVPTGLKIAGFGIIAVGLLFTVDKLVTKAIARKKRKEEELLWEKYYKEKATGKPTSPGGKMSYSPSTYFNFADSIESSLNTAFGEDFEQIAAIFKKIKTQTDFNVLNDAFGERTNYRFGIPHYTGNLAYWIADEYSGYSSDKQKLNNILAANGIDVRF